MARRLNFTAPKMQMGKRRTGKILLFVLGALVALVVIARVVADPIATSVLRKTLARGEGFHGAIDRAHVRFLPPGIEITKLKLIEMPGGRWDEPLFYVDKAISVLDWRQLLHGRLVATARLEGPKIVMVRKHEEKAEKGQSISETLADKSPFKVDRVEVVDGEVLFAAGAGKKAPQVWIHDIELAAENIATRKALLEGEPTRLSVRAKVQRSGVATVFASMDPFAKKLTFAVEATLKDLAARDLYSFLAPATDLQATSGSVSVFASVKVKDGVISGGVKPVLKNIELRSAEDGAVAKLKAWFADQAVDFASDSVPGRNALATVVPIKGSIDGPEVQILPAVLGVLRNAFVQALSDGFTHVPPKTAEKKEGFFKQTKDALVGKSPPDAQPQN